MWDLIFALIAVAAVAFVTFGVMSPIIDGAAKALGRVLDSRPGHRSAGYGAGAGFMLFAIVVGAIILALS